MFFVFDKPSLRLPISILVEMSQMGRGFNHSFFSKILKSTCHDSFLLPALHFHCIFPWSIFWNIMYFSCLQWTCPWYCNLRALMMFSSSLSLDIHLNTYSLVTYYLFIRVSSRGGGKWTFLAPLCASPVRVTPPSFPCHTAAQAWRSTNQFHL